MVGDQGGEGGVVLQETLKIIRIIIKKQTFYLVYLYYVMTEHELLLILTNYIAYSHCDF